MFFSFLFFYPNADQKVCSTRVSSHFFTMLTVTILFSRTKHAICYLLTHCCKEKYKTLFCLYSYCFYPANWGAPICEVCFFYVEVLIGWLAHQNIWSSIWSLNICALTCAPDQIVNDKWIISGYTVRQWFPTLSSPGPIFKSQIFLQPTSDRRNE